MAAEEDPVLARLVQGVEDVHPAAGRVDEEDLGFGDVPEAGDVRGLTDRGDRQELDRELRLLGQGRELALDAGGLGAGVRFRRDPAPRTPARLGPALRDLVDQDGLDLERRRPPDLIGRRGAARREAARRGRPRRRSRARSRRRP
ncbi:MAG: hypothetical protein MZV64_63665 [Ignavibacteriales bacterium]|nr:hypothetical protein [Ignavibacteriales bacterium]